MGLTQPQSFQQDEILSCDSFNSFTCWCPSDRSIRGWRKSSSCPHGEIRTSSGLLCWHCRDPHHLPSSGGSIWSHAVKAAAIKMQSDTWEAASCGGGRWRCRTRFFNHEEIYWADQELCRGKHCCRPK